MRVGVVQTRLQKKPEDAFDYGLALLEEALEKDCGFVCFPEMWLTGFNCNESRIAMAEAYLERVRELSSSSDCIIVAGTFPERAEEGVYNTAYVFFKGSLYKRRKRYLFGLMNEPELFLSGEPPEVMELNGVKFGIIICYELRFPELSKLLALRGADILFVPAQWPDARVEHWRVLLRARAVENQFFVAGVNVVGKGTALSFSGFSALYHPLGNPVIEVSKTHGLFVADIDFGDAVSYRKSIPVLEDSVKYGFVKGF